MYNLYFLKFNNYINRIIKKFDTIEEYIPYVSGTRENININLNDGINASTEAINLKSTDSEITKSNYLIIEDTETLELSRWFIMECKKTRGKQYIFSLRRDVIADNYDDVLNAKSFIYKGYVEYSDPACIIKENLSFNQIKKEELYLKEDDFPFSCLVAFVSKETSFEGGNNLVNFKFDKSIDFYDVNDWFGKYFLNVLTNENILEYSVEYTLNSDNTRTKTQKVNSTIIETSSPINDERNLLSASEGILFYINNNIYKLNYNYENSTKTETYNFVKLINDDLVYELQLNLSDNRTSLDDGFYDMIVIPYEDGIYNLKYINKQDILNIMTSMANNSYFYDVQLLPYRPIDSLNFTIESFDKYKIYRFNNDYAIYNVATIRKKQNETYTETYLRLYWCHSSKREFNIIYYYSGESEIEINTKHKLDNKEYKYISNCQTLRLCSPNENSIYEFNAAPNGGINSYNVDLKYSPYLSYIHINPNYNFLNGSDFNDYRGLICRGNFSLGRASSAWEEYKIQNKNYQQTFDRGIETMEKEINWQLASGIINTMSSAVSGAGLGSMTGNIAGTVVGGITGAVQGIYNTAEQQVLARERMSAEKDIFNYNLGSIKARPNTISNNSVLDNNNKIFPYLEIYECSEKEKQIFKDIIDYQGMTLNRIGEIKNYLGNKNFIQARLIKIDINEDDHFLQELNFELMKGVYLNGN